MCKIKVVAYKIHTVGSCISSANLMYNMKAKIQLLKVLLNTLERD